MSAWRPLADPRVVVPGRCNLWPTSFHFHTVLSKSCDIKVNTPILGVGAPRPGNPRSATGEEKLLETTGNGSFVLREREHESKSDDSQIKNLVGYLLVTREGTVLV